MQSMPQLPLQQHPNFAAAVRKLGRKTEVVELNGSAPIQTLVWFGLRFASRGPIWLGAPAATDVSAVRRSGLHLINSDGGDQQALFGAGYRQIVQPLQVAELSILGSHEDRLARLKGKWRNALRGAWNSSQVIQSETFCKRRHKWLLEADSEQQRAKGFRNLPHEFLQAYADANLGRSIVFSAYSKAEPIAAMLFLVHGSVATYHLGWTGIEGRKHRSHHAILMQAGDCLSAQGVERIDLGKIDRVNSRNLARFKSGTGAVTRSLGGTWVRVPFL